LLVLMLLMSCIRLITIPAMLRSWLWRQGRHVCYISAL
jgi:hypothetical protein